MTTSDNPRSAELIRWGRDTLCAEGEALLRLADRLDDGFAAACRLIAEAPGRVVATGVGKAGLVARKVAASLASTGTPAYWMDPCNALHGDLGMVVAGDVLLAFSKSGEAGELVRLLSPACAAGARAIAVTCDSSSSLARGSEVVLDLGPLEEAGPLGLAPSTSATAMLAVGDALVFALMRLKGIDKGAYARCHPAGDIGRRLLRVEDVMRQGADVPTVTAGVPVREMLMRRSRLKGTHRPPGAAAVVDEGGVLVGIFTDGDLRRHLEAGGDFLNRPVGDVMTPSPRSGAAGCTAIEVARLMTQREIDELPIVDGEGKLVGMVDVQDLLAVGLVTPGAADDTGNE